MAWAIPVRHDQGIGESGIADIGYVAAVAIRLQTCVAVPEAARHATDTWCPRRSPRGSGSTAPVPVEQAPIRGPRRAWRLADLGNKRRRWWGDHYEVRPDELIAELNRVGDYQRITALLRRYRTLSR
jgi:hypothetical protein